MAYRGYAMSEEIYDGLEKLTQHGLAWKARALKAEADAKGWEEMHDKAAKSRDENLAARIKAEAECEVRRKAHKLACQEAAEQERARLKAEAAEDAIMALLEESQANCLDAIKGGEAERAALLKAEEALRAVTETVHSTELPGAAKLIAIDLIVRAALNNPPPEPTS